MDEAHYESIDSQSGAVDYYTYIQSDRWRQKANQAKQRAGYRCQICNRSASETQLDAHHRTYERLGNEAPEDITVLCRDCHFLYEANNKLRKRSVLPDGSDRRFASVVTDSALPLSSQTEHQDGYSTLDDVHQFVDPEKYLLTRMGRAIYGVGAVGSILWLLWIDIYLLSGDWWRLIDPEFFVLTGSIWLQSSLLWQLAFIAITGWGLAKGSVWLVDRIKPSSGALRWYWRWSPSALTKVPFFILVVANLIFFPESLLYYSTYAVTQQPTVLQFPLVLPVLSVYLALLPLPFVHLIWDNSHRSGWGKLLITVAMQLAVMVMSFVVAGLIYNLARSGGGI